MRAARLHLPRHVHRRIGARGRCAVSVSPQPPPLVPIAVLALIIGVLLIVPPAQASQSVPGQGRGSTLVGLTYSPEHLHEWPLAGGWPDRRQLEAAIDDDLRLLSHYVTRIRTRASQYYGIAVAPIAARYGLRVHLAVNLWSWFFIEAEINAAVEAVRRYPKTVEAITLGDTVEYHESTEVLCALMDKIQSQLGPELAKEVRFGTYATRASELHCTPTRSFVDMVDFIGTLYRPSSLAMALDAEELTGRWQDAVQKPQDRHKLRALTVEYVAPATANFTSREWTSTIATNLDFLQSWAPPGGGDVIVFGGNAFDSLKVQVRVSVDIQTLGVFSSDRKRKLPGFPPPLRADQDPSQLERAPVDPHCPMGMYQLTLKSLDSAVIACHVTGYNFHVPTNFDERLLNATCGNRYCQVVIGALKSNLRTPRCPFDNDVTEKTLRELIIKPVEEYCRLVSTSQSDSYHLVIIRADSDMRPGIGTCLGNGLMDLFDARSSQRERCQDRSGFDGRALTQTVLEKMCAEPSCELLMQQLANPFGGVTCHNEHQWLENNILRPYFDGCYEKTQMAASYFDVAYRPRRDRPLLPSLEPTRTEPTMPLPRSSHSQHGEGSALEAPSTTSVPIANMTTKHWPVSKTLMVVALVILLVGIVVFVVVVVRSKTKPNQLGHLPRAHLGNDLRQSHCSTDKGIHHRTATSKHDYYSPVWADIALSQLFVNPQQLQDIKMIGSGGQGLVYLVVYQPDQSKQINTNAGISENVRNGAVCLAAKRLTRATINANPNAINQFVAEIKLVASLRHPNIVSLVGVSWTTGTDIQALFELMPDGDLCAYLSSTPRYEWTEKKFRLALDVIEALAYAHSRSPVVVHRDIKSRNVLLTPFFPVTADATTVMDANNSTVDRRLGAKLTDFGVSRHLSVNATMTTGVGTSRWLAPEVILGGGDYDESSDVYSFGVLLSELDTHALPFVERRTLTGDMLPDIALLQMVAMEGVTPAFMGSSPVALVALAHECLAYDPSQRPTADQVCCRLQELCMGRRGEQSNRWAPSTPPIIPRVAHR